MHRKGSIDMLLVVLLAAGGGFSAQAAQLKATAIPISTAITYQGQLKKKQYAVHRQL